MGRDIHFKFTATRPFMTREIIEAEQFVLAFNQLFKDGGRCSNGLLNFSVYGDKPEDYTLFLDGRGAGSSRPYGDDVAVLLFAGLVILSRILPSAWVEVSDERKRAMGGLGSFVLGNGLLRDLREPAKCLPSGILVSDLNQMLPPQMRPVEPGSAKGGLTQKMFSPLVAEIERVTRERMSKGALLMAEFFSSSDSASE